MLCFICRFGSPVVLQVPRDIAYIELQNTILHNMGFRGADVQQVRGYDRPSLADTVFDLIGARDA